jgi:hypothetical protein
VLERVSGKARCRISLSSQRGEVAGGCPEAPGRLGRAESRQRRGIGLLNKMKTDNLSKETTKHNQTGYTASEPSESTNPGAPLSQGDALVAYENLKREKNSEGNEDGEKKFNINVCRV